MQSDKPQKPKPVIVTLILQIDVTDVDAKDFAQAREELRGYAATLLDVHDAGKLLGSYVRPKWVPKDRRKETKK